MIGVGLWNLYRGLALKFEDRWRTGEMGATARRWAGRGGAVIAWNDSDPGSRYMFGLSPM